MKKVETLKAGLIGAVATFITTPAFARTVELKEAGAALWVFAAIGAIIVLLQLIPAVLLFFSFIGTTITAALKKEKVAPVEVMVPVAEPVVVKK